MTEVPPATYSAAMLRTFCEEILRHFDVPAKDAAAAADVLIAGDLRGIDSHGIARLPMYAKYLANGQFNPRPSITVVRESPSTATIDADRGLGIMLGPKAMQIAIEKAREVGMGVVTMRNGRHLGQNPCVRRAARTDSGARGAQGVSPPSTRTWKKRRVLGK